jgi:hypothetical protein
VRIVPRASMRNARSCHMRHRTHRNDAQPSHLDEHSAEVLAFS